MISSCSFPEIGNFDILKHHFRVICEHMDWRWSGDILISAAGLANAPILFDRKYELIRKTGAELINSETSKETTEAIAAPVMPAEDYRRMTTLNFQGGPDAEAEIVTIAMKAMNR